MRDTLRIIWASARSIPAGDYMCVYVWAALIFVMLTWHWWAGR